MTNNCDIRIELDEDKRTYEAGDTVSGTVHVEANKDCQCDDLILELEWHTGAETRSRIASVSNLCFGASGRRESITNTTLRSSCPQAPTRTTATT